MGIEIDILSPEHLPLVEPIISAEFGNAMPWTPAQAAFVAAIDGEKLAGFVHVEVLYHLCATWVAPEYRGTGLGMRLLRNAIERTPAGHSTVLLTDREVTRVAKRLKARYLGKYSFYRRDM